MKVVEWDVAYAEDVATWHYEPPWDFYALASDPDDAAVTEVGIGLRPDLTGRRRGESFLEGQLDYASGQWEPAPFRLFVAAWNAQAIRLYERFGFREVSSETRHFELVGDHEFVQMERAA